MNKSMKKIGVLCLICVCFCLSAMTVCAANVYISKYLRYTVEDSSVTIVGYNGSESEVTIPARIAGNPVNTIAEGAFADCTTVEKVSLPDTIMTIEEGAFAPGQEIVYSSSLNGSQTTEDEQGSEDNSNNNQATTPSVPGNATENTTTDKAEESQNVGDVDEGEIIMGEEDGLEQEMQADMDKNEDVQKRRANNKIWAYAIVLALVIVAVAGIFIGVKKTKNRR